MAINTFDAFCFTFLLWNSLDILLLNVAVKS